MAGRLRYAIILISVVLLSLPLAALAAPREQATGGQYVVKPGDTLADIAWSLGVPAGDLGRANGITDFDMIYAGQVLTLPGQTSRAAAGPPPAAEVSTAETSA